MISSSIIEKIKVLLLAIIAVCLVIIVIQGFGWGERNVWVGGGSVDVDGSVYLDGGSVSVDGGSVSVDGGSVSVENTVDVNLDKVLGYPVGCHRSYTIDGKEYQAIDVFQSNKW